MLLWQRRGRTLSFGGSKLNCVEEVTLPDWDKLNCPWCDEKKNLEEILSRAAYKNLNVYQFLRDRVEELRRTESTGLTDNAFFKLGNYEKPKFLGGSIFCSRAEICESDMINAVASAIQHPRNGYTDKNGILHQLRSHHPFYSIIHYRDFLCGDKRFFEPYIKAAIIRSCRHSELHASESLY